MEARADEARRALVLNDRPLIVGLIQLTLNHGLFVVQAASSLREAESILAEWRPHVSVIDMEHADAAALLQRLGASNTLTPSKTPVVGLTRGGGLQSKLRAFDLGVDDILTVPFSPEELLARVIVVTRRATGRDRPIVPAITLGEIEIDILNRQIRDGESVIHLSGIEQSLLYILASRGGRVVAREEILDAIWGPDYVAESNIVDRHIRRLRAKLHDDYRHPRFIATVPGRGYRLVPTFSNAGWAPDPSTTKSRPPGTTKQRTAPALTDGGHSSGRVSVSQVNSRATPQTIRHNDQATYAIEVTRSATHQPSDSLRPTNSSAVMSSAPPIGIAHQPSQIGSPVLPITKAPVKSVQLPVIR